MKERLCLGKISCLVMATAMGAGLAVSASAETVLMDFGTNLSFRGVSTTSPDVNGNSWNNYVPGNFIQDMKDTSGVATTIDFGPEGGFGVGTDSYNGPAGATDMGTPASNLPNTDIDAAALGKLGIQSAAFDYAASPGPDASDNMAANLARFQIQGLDLAKTYTLTLYGSHKYSADTTTVYSVFDDTGYSSLVGTANLNVHDPVDFSAHNRNEVATIGNLTPDANGILYLQFVGATARRVF